MSRFVRPEVVRLPLSDGDWIMVKKRLTVGEQHAVFEKMIHAPDVTIDSTGAAAVARVSIEPVSASMGLVLAYLVDWNLQDDDGAAVPIAGLGADDLRATVETLEPDSYNEILKAIRTHEKATIAERAKKKTVKNGAIESLDTSTLPAVAVGGTSG